MSRPLAPRAIPGENTNNAGNLGSGGNPPGQPPSHRPRKISTACGACKQRKTRCSGGHPCEACSSRDSVCVYDATSDQRRKIANQRNVQDLVEAQISLERHRQLLGGILATLRVGNAGEVRDMISLVQRGVDLSQLAAHVRNTCRASIEIQHSYSMIDFTIDGEDKLPHPGQIFGTLPPTSGTSVGSRSSFSDGGGDGQQGFQEEHGTEQNP